MKYDTKRQFFSFTLYSMERVDTLLNYKDYFSRDFVTYYLVY